MQISPIDSDINGQEVGPLKTKNKEKRSTTSSLFRG